jgi:hypothetical protein
MGRSTLRVPPPRDANYFYGAMNRERINLIDVAVQVQVLGKR